MPQREGPRLEKLKHIQAERRLKEAVLEDRGTTPVRPKTWSLSAASTASSAPNACAASSGITYERRGGWIPNGAMRGYNAGWHDVPGGTYRG